MNTNIKSPLGEGPQRLALMEELYKRYGTGATGPGGWRLRLRYWRKKYAWIIVVGGSKILKRTIDIAASSLLFLLLWPLFLAVALCIKLTDGGPTQIGCLGLTSSRPDPPRNRLNPNCSSGPAPPIQKARTTDCGPAGPGSRRHSSKTSLATWMKTGSDLISYPCPLEENHRLKFPNR